MDTRRCAITNQNKIKYIQKQNLIILLHECVHSNVHVSTYIMTHKILNGEKEKIWMQHFGV